jgi:hypothetical protein
MCKKLCHHLNDGICLGFCAIGVNSGGYSIRSMGDKLSISHSSIQSPMVVVERNAVDVQFIIEVLQIQSDPLNIDLKQLA